MSELPSCINCGVNPTTTLVFPLHGDKGGPIVCQKCAEWIDNLYSRPGSKKQLQLDALDFFGIGPPGKPASARPGELTRELLDETLQLTHPDRHPERLALATKVTAALTTLRPYLRETAKVEPAATTVTDKSPSPRWTVDETLRKTFPCRTCFTLVPMYYCDACRKEWKTRQQQERDAQNKKRRDYRAKRLAMRPPLVCRICGTQIRSKRKDAKTCSPRCRVQMHRKKIPADRLDRTGLHYAAFKNTAKKIPQPKLAREKDPNPVRIF
jgi:hypothetical protein